MINSIFQRLIETEIFLAQLERVISTEQNTDEHAGIPEVPQPVCHAHYKSALREITVGLQRLFFYGISFAKIQYTQERNITDIKQVLKCRLFNSKCYVDVNRNESIKQKLSEVKTWQF